MTTAPLETPIELFDIELEHMMDGDVTCKNHPAEPAVATIDHTGCPHPPAPICAPCAARVRDILHTATTDPVHYALACGECPARRIPPADFTIRPI